MRAILAVLLGVTAATAAEPVKKPNIVYVLADDLGRQDCGFMGGKDIPTPHLDKLAKAGAVLDAFYVQPVCSPTRAAFMTGRYPMRHGLQIGVVRPWAQYGLPLDEQTLPAGLKSAGYKTAICGKWHLGHFDPAYLPTKRGFDHQYGHYNGALDYFTHVRDGGFDWHRDDVVNRDEGYSTHLIAKEAATFVADTAGKAPFFLYVPFNGVHAPHQAPEEYLKKFPDLKGERKKYAAMLSALDDGVGTIAAALEKAGVANDTLFIFSSDNGGPQPGTVTDNGPYRAGKGTLYEGGTRVAAFVTWPGHVTAGTTIREPLHMVDWYPTLLKLAGATVEQKLPLDGLDIAATLTDGKPSPHATILINTTPTNGAVRAGDWKLVVKTATEDPDGEPGKALAKPSVELFNLKDDPYEKTNLAEKQPEKVAELRKALDGYAKQAVPPKAKPKAKDFVTPKVWGEKP